MRRLAHPLAVASALALVAPSGAALAHEKWFLDSRAYAADLGSAFAFPALPFVLLAAAVTLVAYGLWRARGRRGLLPGPELFGADDARRSRLYALVPAILGVHLAVPLLIAGVTGRLFSPGVELTAGWPYLLGLAQTGIALAFFYGGFARVAAVVLAALWGLGFWVASPVAMLENVHILGFAAFFFLAGRGPFAIDRLIFPRLEPPARLMAHAVPALRIGAGLSLVVLAFTEKLANLPLALAFLEEYPLNFTRVLGLPVPDETFVLMAGAVELLIGLLLVFGIFVRAAIVVAWIPFNLTLTVFTWTELVGHLPFYGIMAVLLVWTPGAPEREVWVRGLREGPLRLSPTAGRG